ncbi:uncharacterized protein AMSG_00368 [Thecamonas trahens ATCC 50062]|uniref:Uncharacterized protein n=1 Tax=Thecamonas trahens ATCC 50062 TaxID=461836 RepID=A0A0L0D974_THETB|nr:hypothetical protein AMSG_00368 [Thecamonas trahens ATCC 50062]KNC48591.1 hypothetical protein AMSG_00368 [Thecamonas trahens ATCC 50062]|eukprot:XP_013762647.1 hypothetical protein AMSG_00368 [Thecamonas trahens ATCC 50062]
MPSSASSGRPRTASGADADGGAKAADGLASAASRTEAKPGAVAEEQGPGRLLAQKRLSQGSETKLQATGSSEMTLSPRKTGNIYESNASVRSPVSSTSDVMLSGSVRIMTAKVTSKSPSGITRGSQSQFVRKNSGPILRNGDSLAPTKPGGRRSSVELRNSLSASISLLESLPEVNEQVMVRPSSRQTLGVENSTGSAASLSASVMGSLLDEEADVEPTLVGLTYSLFLDIQRLRPADSPLSKTEFLLRVIKRIMIIRRTIKAGDGGRDSISLADYLAPQNRRMSTTLTLPSRKQLSGGSGSLSRSPSPRLVVVKPDNGREKEKSKGKEKERDGDGESDDDSDDDSDSDSSSGSSDDSEDGSAVPRGGFASLEATLAAVQAAVAAKDGGRSDSLAAFQAEAEAIRARNSADVDAKTSEVPVTQMSGTRTSISGSALDKDSDSDLELDGVLDDSELEDIVESVAVIVRLAKARIEQASNISKRYQRKRGEPRLSAVLGYPDSLSDYKFPEVAQTMMQTYHAPGKAQLAPSGRALSRTRSASRLDVDAATDTQIFSTVQKWKRKMQSVSVEAMAANGRGGTMVDASMNDMRRASKLVATLLSHARAKLVSGKKIAVSRIIDPELASSMTRTFHGKIEDGTLVEDVELDEFFSLLQKGIRGEIWLNRKLPSNVFRKELRSSRALVREKSRGSPSFQRALSRSCRSSAVGLDGAPIPGLPQPQGPGSGTPPRRTSGPRLIPASAAKPRNSIVTSLVRNSEMFDTI